MKLNYGDAAAIEVSKRIGAPVATMAELKAIPGDRRVDGQTFIVLADDSRWQFDAASALTGDDVLVATPGSGSGRFLRMVGGVLLKLPFTFATADTTALLTLQAGQLLSIQEVYHEVTADFTGGAASTIGVSSNKTGFTAKGDLLGGAAGAAAAALTATIGNCFGTIGAGFDTLAKRRVLFEPTATIKHDHITSAFTAGTGSVCLVANLLKNAGA